MSQEKEKAISSQFCVIMKSSAEIRTFEIIKETIN